jgi:hypothetical protein
VGKKTKAYGLLSAFTEFACPNNERTRALGCDPEIVARTGYIELHGTALISHVRFSEFTREVLPVGYGTRETRNLFGAYSDYQQIGKGLLEAEPGARMPEILEVLESFGLKFHCFRSISRRADYVARGERAMTTEEDQAFAAMLEQWKQSTDRSREELELVTTLLRLDSHYWSLNKVRDELQIRRDAGDPPPEAKGQEWQEWQELLSKKRHERRIQREDRARAARAAKAAKHAAATQQKEMASLRVSLRNMQQREASREELLHEVLRENRELREAQEELLRELQEARELLDLVLDSVEDARARLKPEAKEALNEFLAEWVLLASDPGHRRRYSERMYELSFILHRHSPEAYDLLRQTLSLPAASCLLKHFAEVMTAEKPELEDLAGMQARLEAHVKEHLIGSYLVDEAAKTADLAGEGALAAAEIARRCAAALEEPDFGPADAERLSGQAAALEDGALSLDGVAARIRDDARELSVHREQFEGVVAELNSLVEDVNKTISAVKAQVNAVHESRKAARSGADSVLGAAWGDAVTEDEVELFELEREERKLRRSMGTPTGIRCGVISDATKATTTGMGGKAVASAHVFGVVFFDTRIPDLWVHVAQTNGRLREVIEDETAVKQACTDAGFTLLIVATDGDSSTNERHRVAFESYTKDADPTQISLFSIVTVLFDDGPPTAWPVSDFLHLLKNMRMRIINNGVADCPDGKRVSAAGLKAALGDVPGLRNTSANTAMRDGDALALFTPEVVSRCFSAGESEAGRFLTPWMLMALVIREPKISREARLQLLEVSFAILLTWSQTLHPTGATQGIMQNAKKAQGLPLTFSDQEHLHRACNLCVILYYALVKFDDRVLPMSRISSHPCEAHFGSIRAVLREITRYDAWVSAEAFVSLMDQFVTELRLHKRPRPKRAIGGCDIVPSEQETGEEMAGLEAAGAELLRLACMFAQGEPESTGKLWAALSDCLGTLRVVAPASEFLPGPLQGVLTGARFRVSS